MPNYINNYINGNRKYSNRKSAIISLGGKQDRSNCSCSSDFQLMPVVEPPPHSSLLRELMPIVPEPFLVWGYELIVSPGTCTQLSPHSGSLISLRLPYILHLSIFLIPRCFFVSLLCGFVSAKNLLFSVWCDVGRKGKCMCYFTMVNWKSPKTKSCNSNNNHGNGFLF